MRRRPLPPGVLLALVLAATVLRPAPATAHPFGPPPTAKLSAAGNVVTVTWSATPDDAVAIGERLGVMPAGSIAAYRQESAAQVAPSAADEARLSASAELTGYLTEHIAATQDGAACPGTVTARDDFVHTGATVVLTCPEPVAEVSLRITMLHDLHPAYRTFAVGTATTPGTGVFTVESPEQTWRFGAAPGSSPAPALAAGAAVVLAALGGLWWRRRRA